MLFDWLGREGGIVLSWWALVTLAGVAALPLCLRLLGGLPDRGYTLARAAGLLLVGFVFWLLACLGFLRNTTDSMVLAWALVLLIGLVVYWRAGTTRVDLRAWWRENRRVIVVGEILFFVLLFSWAIYRAYQNSLTGTEKPMELAFLSATMRSDIFPPADPWLSGYAISYYYFGYVIMAMLSSLSGVVSTVGFNMATALLFALTGITSFGVVYNLVRSRSLTLPKRGALLTGLLGMVFVILMGNFSTLLVEIPYQTGTASEGYLRFWNMNERQTPLQSPGRSDISEWDNWWWFRAARVLNDFNLDDNREEVIDEFPQFSFLLSDNHPHVLSLPFAVLALGLALNTLLSKRAPNRCEVLFYAICFGGLIFLNTWDGPIYLIILLAAEALRRLMERGRLRGGDFGALIWLGVRMLFIAVILYLPFLVAFRSQLSGILPNLQYPTLFPQFFMMFGPLLLIILPFLAVEGWRAGRRMNWGMGLKVGFGLLGGLIALMLLLTLLFWIIPEARGAVMSFVNTNGGWGNVIPDLLSKRITHSLTALFLAVGLIVIVARLFPRKVVETEDEVPAEFAADPLAQKATGKIKITYSPQVGFALLLVAAACVLTLVPEFVYLRDAFNTRMNTVFKFYYQSWLLFSVGGAFAIYSLFAGAGERLPSLVVRGAYAALTVAVVGAGLLYPYLGIQSRMYYDVGRTLGYRDTLTLDGGGTISGDGDYLAARCLSDVTAGEGDVVVVSAVGGSYDWVSGVVSTYSGVPTLFNWPYHQVQWRGGTFSEAAGSRESDIDRLYGDLSWGSAQGIINQYGIDYIVYGSKERSKYSGSNELKFLENLDVVCEFSGTKIFHVPERALAQAE